MVSEIVLGMNALDKTPASIKVQRDTTSYSKNHKHRFVEIAYFYHGKGKHEIEDEVFEVTAGDLFVLNGNVGHKFHGEELRVVNIMFDATCVDKGYLNANFIEDFYKKHFGGGSDQSVFTDGFLHVPGFSLKQSDSIIYNMLQEYNAKMDCYIDVLRSNIEILMINAIRLSFAETSKNHTIIMHKNLLEKAISYIDENAKEINRVEDIMDKIGYNKLYFNRLFKDYTGMSISKYVRKKKIEKAVHLLLHTNYTVEKICEMVGYFDIKSFYCSFKREMNTSPGAYRQQQYTIEKK